MINSFSFVEVDRIVSAMYPANRVQIKPFSLVFNFGQIAAAGSGVVIIKTPSNADFIAFDMNIVNAESASFTTETLQIEDSGSNERFFDTPVPVTSVCSVQTNLRSGFAYPRKIAGNSTLTATIAAGSLLSTSSQLTIDGVLVYPY